MLCGVFRSLINFIFIQWIQLRAPQSFFVSSNLSLSPRRQAKPSYNNTFGWDITQTQKNIFNDFFCFFFSFFFLCSARRSPSFFHSSRVLRFHFFPPESSQSTEQSRKNGIRKTHNNRRAVSLCGDLIGCPGNKSIKIHINVK